MLICNRPNRDAIHDPAPFDAGNSNISFVHKFCYLGCTIDRDMTMYHEYKALYRKVEHQIFMLGKKISSIGLQAGNTTLS